MFEVGEHEDCPVCNMKLSALEKLPLSMDAAAEDGVPTAPEAELLPWTYMGRGKGILVGVALVGLGMFFLPWVHLTFPYMDDRSAFNMASGRMGWLWAVACAWMVLLPTVLSRRSIVQMWGARVAAAFLAAIPAVAVAMLMMFPPRSVSGGITIRFSYGWPIWVTLAAAVVGVVFAVRLGGTATDIRVQRGSSQGQNLH